MGSDIEIDVEFINPGFVGHSGTLYVLDARFVVPPGGGETEPTYFPLDDDGPYSLSLAAFGGTDTVTITLDSLPDHVTSGYIEIDLEAWEGENVLWTTSGWTTWESVFVILGAPQYRQEVPWKEVLELGCGWAEGLDEEHDCAEATTLELFDAGLFTYNLNEPGVPSHYCNQGTGLYNLKGFLEDFKPAPGNCVDVSTFNGIVLNALGVVVALKREFGEYDSEPVDYVTNLVCPIGTSRTSSGNYKLISFLMHQQTHVSFYVYDAALAYLVDLDGETYMLPAVGWLFWPFAHYWQCPTTEPLYGHAKRYYYSNVDSPTIDPDIPNEVVDYQAYLFTYSGVK